jgi:hypothetical protein
MSLFVSVGPRSSRLSSRKHVSLWKWLYRTTCYPGGLYKSAILGDLCRKLDHCTMPPSHRCWGQLLHIGICVPYCDRRRIRDKHGDRAGRNVDCGATNDAMLHQDVGGIRVASPPCTQSGRNAYRLYKKRGSEIENGQKHCRSFGRSRGVVSPHLRIVQQAFMSHYITQDVICQSGINWEVGGVRVWLIPIGASSNS